MTSVTIAIKIFLIFGPTSSSTKFIHVFQFSSKTIYLLIFGASLCIASGGRTLSFVYVKYAICRFLACVHEVQLRLYFKMCIDVDCKPTALNSSHFVYNFFALTVSSVLKVYFFSLIANNCLF